MFSKTFSHMLRVTSGSMKRFRRGKSNSETSSILSNKMEVNGFHMHYETTGNGPINVLLMPGALGSTRTDFNYQLEQFNKTDFTVIAVDPRGYGKSIPPERDWPLEFLQRDADDALELVHKLDLKKVSLLGWSDGGITAMIAAAKGPDVVDKLVIWGANAYITKQDMDAFNAVRDISAWSERMRGPFLELYGEEYFRTQWSKWVDAYHNYVVNRNADICMGDLEKITAKTLIIHGLKDFMVPLEHADYLHQHIKGSRLYILPDGKHNLHQKYHKEFNSMVEFFLKQ